MSKVAAFCDSSALVPLCVQEITSRQAQSQVRKSLPVVWWGSPVEVQSAITRLHRQGRLKDVEKQGALSRLALLSRGWREILLADSLRDSGATPTRCLPIASRRQPATCRCPDLVPAAPHAEKFCVRRSTPLKSCRSDRLFRPSAFTCYSLIVPLTFCLRSDRPCACPDNGSLWSVSGGSATAQR